MKGDDATIYAEGMGRRKPNSECVARRRCKVADDEQRGRRANRDLDRGEGESDIRRGRSDLGEQVRSIRQPEGGRGIRGGGARNFNLERVEGDRLAMRRQCELEERHVMPAMTSGT